MKGFQVFRNLATDEECQAIVDSIDRQEDDWLQNRWEVKKFEIPQSVIDKAQKCLGDEKLSLVGFKLIFKEIVLLLIEMPYGTLYQYTAQQNKYANETEILVCLFC